LFSFFYLLRNFFYGISASGADPRYFGARNERECGTLSFLWTSLMVFRWPMMIGFAILGLFLVNGFFPDHGVLASASELIKSSLGPIPRERWFDTISGIIHFPEKQSPELIAALKALLKDNWQAKLHLLSYDGTVNAEQIVPGVIMYYIPVGLRGFIFIAFVAAALSSFNSNVNSTTAYFTRDLYQHYIRRYAKNRELIIASYLFSIFLVGSGFILAYNIESINQIWGWIVMGLGGGIAIPAMLKFYWWRYNGYGFAAGTTVGIIASVAQAYFFPGLLEWQQFTLVAVVSLIAAIAGTLLSKPIDEKVLENFYLTTRPFGFWKPLKAKLNPALKSKMEREHKNDIISVPFTLIWQISLFLLPMQFMVRSYGEFFITLALCLACLTGMYFFWYRNLPPKKAAGQDVSDNSSALKEEILTE
ncbi:MAG: sodium:solute symporter, partial [Bacteroidota bacterium]|nr:sodium:solute symporter [Bacteroidota bacterium]